MPLTQNDVETAKRNLEQHFTVGVTENMDSFLTLVARELDWPTEAICNVPVHVNTMNRPKTTELPKELIQYIEKKTAMDSEIHEYASQLHDEQTQRFAILCHSGRYLRLRARCYFHCSGTTDSASRCRSTA